MSSESLSNKDINKKIMAGLTLVYFIILLWVIVFKCNQNEFLHIELNREIPVADRIEPYPFSKWVLLYNERYFSLLEITAFLFNFICMLPFGALLRFFTKKNWLIITMGVLFSLAIEMFQLFSGWGGLEYTDIVTMVLGVIVGIWIYDFLRPKWSEKFINRLATFFLAVGAPLAILTVISTIINFPI